MTLTNQEIYDRIKTHLLTQMKKSGKRVVVHGVGNREFMCFYRHPDDPSLKCAIGRIIPDIVYKPWFEDKSASFLVESYPSVRKLFQTTDTFKLGNFLNEAQYIHDKNPPSKWAQRLRGFAKRWNLNP